MAVETVLLKMVVATGLANGLAAVSTIHRLNCKKLTVGTFYVSELGAVASVQVHHQRLQLLQRLELLRWLHQTPRHLSLISLKVQSNKQ